MQDTAPHKATCPKRSRKCIGQLGFWFVAKTMAVAMVTAFLSVDGYIPFIGCKPQHRHHCNHYFPKRIYQGTNTLDYEHDEHITNDTHSPKLLANIDGFPEYETNRYSLSRRNAMLNIGSIAAILTMTTSSNVALAAKAEFDSTTGNLFTPKADMLTGGSDAARGLPISRNRVTLNPGQALQSIYETRFVAYLSRFLLNFDPSARAYWVQQGFGDSWDMPLTPAAGTYSDDTVYKRERSADTAFAEFAQSVEVGLADYFSGPFGSYSSLPAIVAGINAAQPAKSKMSDLSDSRHSFLDDIFRKGKVKSNEKKPDGIQSAKQGILNLYTLLKARYNSLSAKRQLAILFSFVSLPDLQPVNEICSLLGEIDNATVTAVEITNSMKVPDEVDSRTSSRRGGGYAYEEFPAILIDSPPPLGDKYRNAQLAPIMTPTSRVLRITITDPGEGYISAPSVTILQHNGLVIRQCQATAILDREGRVESIVILDPGFGYGGGRKNLPPKVVIEPPTNKKPHDKPLRAAKAFAQLEYKINGIRIVDGGTGFCSTEPPKIVINPPTVDPDWYLDVQDLPAMRMIPVPKREPLRAVVTEMRFADGNVAYSSNGMPDRSNLINDNLIERLVRDPLELLPSTVRPELILEPRLGKIIYSIPQLAVVPQFVAVMSPRYRAYDPIFGGVGRIPVTKGANELTVSEYARLALSGAVCTVAVRTALNPLELIKTKQQLQYDDELFDYIKSKQYKNKNITTPTPHQLDESNTLLPPDTVTVSRSNAATLIAPTHPQVSIEATPAIPKTNVGTLEMIRSIIELRGPLALFQSADITFLASLVFGSFGFGATELFRRWFTIFFIPDTNGVMRSASESELVLLFAASVATVLTALAASPFEVLRVRSMGLVTPKKWTEVLEDFLVRCSADL
jgi:hypothetical protein